MMLITTPGVDIIYENPSPVSKVGTHPEQLSLNIPNFDEYVYSGLWYHLAQAHANSFTFAEHYLNITKRYFLLYIQKTTRKYTLSFYFENIQVGKIKFNKYFIYVNMFILLSILKRSIQTRFIHKL